METVLIALVSAVVAVLLVGIALLVSEEERKASVLQGPPKMSGGSLRKLS
jgi:hypothetical protein